MIAGRLNYIVQLLHPVETTNAFGEKAVTWAKAACIRAERVSLTGKRSEEVAEHFPDLRSLWNIRYVHHVHPNWRLRDQDGVTYTIVAVEPNKPRGYKTLVCERLND